METYTSEGRLFRRIRDEAAGLLRLAGRPFVESGGKEEVVWVNSFLYG